MRERVIDLAAGRNADTNATVCVLNMIDTAIVALEAIDMPTGRVRTALDYLKAERRSLERGVPNAGR